MIKFFNLYIMIANCLIFFLFQNFVSDERNNMSSGVIQTTKSHSRSIIFLLGLILITFVTVIIPTRGNNKFNMLVAFGLYWKSNLQINKYEISL
jgi:hypothetical protein